MADTDKKITAGIIELVTKEMAPQQGSADIEAILRGIAMAYAGFACAFHAREKAQDLLIALADELDEPDWREAALQGIGF
jgi:hypothetical protein